MSYHDILLKYKDLPLGKIFREPAPQEVESSIHSVAPDASRLWALLSPAAEEFLEPMAQKAHALTLQHFGRTIQLYTPMYLSNFCENECAYCGFNARNNMPRRALTLQEVEKEAMFIASTGIEHLLILTGDSREKSPPAYIKECLGVLKKHFSSISAEIYALSEDEYADLARSGIDVLTLYQETYYEGVYDRVHRSGPKKDFLFRLDAPERAAKSGMRSVNIGALLGLDDWRREAFRMGLHAQYLQDRFGEVEIGASLPRLRPAKAGTTSSPERAGVKGLRSHAGDFRETVPVTDKNIAQILMAWRLFLPRLGISLSTRESARLREDLLPLGVTRMSAGSTTRVGGHTILSPEEENIPQFEISDPRDVKEMKTMLAARGYQPVLKDWMQI